MSDSSSSLTDPRVRRTRQLLQEGLAKLLETRDFDRLSVADIADAATVNRATFYDHYPDKFTLLECMVASRFHTLLDARGITFDSSCPAALKAISLALCDYLAGIPAGGSDPQPQRKQHLESAIIAVVRQVLLDGLAKHPAPLAASPEMLAAIASGALYGGAQEWAPLGEPHLTRSRGRCADTTGRTNPRNCRPSHRAESYKLPKGNVDGQ